MLRAPSVTMNAMNYWILDAIKAVKAPRTLSALILTLCATPSSFGISYTVQLSPGLYGNVNQHDMSGYSTSDCAPASGANGLFYLQKEFGLPLFSSTNYSGLLSVANTLASSSYMWTQTGGTTDDNMMEGTVKYIEACSPSKATYSAQDHSSWLDYSQPSWDTLQWPTWSFLYQSLQQGDDVQLGLQYPGGGHAVTLTGFSWNDANGDGLIQKTENAQVFLVDPWTGLTGQGQVWSFADGSLFLAYSGTADITAAFAVHVVPEPSGGGLVALGVLCVFIGGIHRRQRITRPI